MDIVPRCVFCAGTARFCCECQESITFLCAICVTVHLEQLKHVYHQLKNLPWAELPTSQGQGNPPELVQLISDSPAVRFLHALNPGNFEPERINRTEAEKSKPIQLGKQPSTASEEERPTRDLPVIDLFMRSHAHALRQPRKPKPILFSFLPNSKNICFLSPCEGGIAWNQSLRDFPSGVGLCILSTGLILCTGGNCEAGWLTDAFTLDPTSGKIIELPGMIAARECHGCVEYREHIYVFGGVNESGLMSQCESYAQFSRSWQGLPCLEKPMSKLTPVVLNNRIYLAGYGHTAVIEFNPSTQKSKSLFAGLLSSNEAVCAFTCGEHLFLLQGAFLICANVTAGTTSQPSRRKSDHRHWYSPTPLVHSGDFVYFLRWYDEVWEFGLEHLTMRQVLSLDLSQFS